VTEVKGSTMVRRSAICVEFKKLKIIKMIPVYTSGSKQLRLFYCLYTGPFSAKLPLGNKNKYTNIRARNRLYLLSYS
jgi:hypothetical protein